ncbi:MAG TPA: hypothetical protein VEB86_15945 [Chryseosolibacter sp.]|nr:hypothetical protein [Chryseosolibacter sp.]
MFVPFDTLPSTSRIWIYQSNRRFSSDEKAIIARSLHEYCDRWVAHGQPLKSSYLLPHDHFVVLAVDENFNQASGCSIDTSVQAVRDIGAATGIDFFNRELITFTDKSNGTFFIELKKLREGYASGLWNENTLVFDNVVATKGALESGWLKPAAATWLKRYIPAEAVKS